MNSGLDNGTGFRRINGAEEDGRDNNGVRLGLGVSLVLNCGAAMGRTFWAVRFRFSPMMAEREHGQEGHGWLRGVFILIRQVRGDGRRPGNRSAHVLLQFGDGRGQGRRVCSTAGSQKMGRGFTAARFSIHICVGMCRFSTIPVRSRNLSSPSILLMCLKMYRTYLYGEVLRCAELWRMFTSRGNVTLTGGFWLCSFW